jgi:hypothetical protein
METKYTWLILILLIIVCIFLVITRKKNIEHFTFEDVLDNKCSTGGDLHDYDWGTKKCVKSQTQCAGEKVKCYSNDNSFTYFGKIQNPDDGDCKAPANCRTTCATTCDTIECDDGWCTKKEIINPPGNCETECHQYDDCPDFTGGFKWKIHEGKWKKYETKQNYNENGNCVTKFKKENNEWEEIPDDTFYTNYSSCSVDNVTINTNQFIKNGGGQIVCANNESNVWNIFDYTNTNNDEFNNQIKLGLNAAEESGVELWATHSATHKQGFDYAKQPVIDLTHDSNSCLLGQVDDIDIFCPVPVQTVEPVSYVLHKNPSGNNCLTSDGQSMYKKEPFDGEYYILNNQIDYNVIDEKVCHKRCDSMDVEHDKRLILGYVPYDSTTDCRSYEDKCEEYCKTTISKDSQYGHYVKSEIIDQKCECGREGVRSVVGSNCYILPNYERYTKPNVFLSNDDIYDADNHSIQVKCFEPLVDANNTPGFSKIHGECYQLLDGNQSDKYFKYVYRQSSCSEGNDFGCLTTGIHKMELDNSCEPQIPDTPTITISEVENQKTDNSITVYVTTPDIRDPYPYTRLMYTNDPSEESFEALASPYHALRRTTPTTNLVYGNNNEGYINVSGENTITFENLLPNTQYTFQIVTVHDEVVNNNVYSDPLVVSTAPQQTIRPPDTPSLEITGQTHNSITVNISNLDYGDYAYDTTTRTRILYKKSVKDNIIFDELATDTYEELTANCYGNHCYGNQNRGYIELTNDISDKTIIIPNLASNTRYKIKVVIVYGLTPSTIFSNMIPETTSVEKPQIMNVDINSADNRITVTMNWNTTSDGDRVDGWQVRYQPTSNTSNTSSLTRPIITEDLTSALPTYSFSAPVTSGLEEWEFWLTKTANNNIMVESVKESVLINHSAVVAPVLRNVSVSNNQITVSMTWNTATDWNDGNINGYQLRYRRKSGAGSTLFQTPAGIEQMTTYSFSAPVTSGLEEWEFWLTKTANNNIMVESVKESVLIDHSAVVAPVLRNVSINSADNRITVNMNWNTANDDGRVDGWRVRCQPTSNTSSLTRPIRTEDLTSALPTYSFDAPTDRAAGGKGLNWKIWIEKMNGETVEASSSKSTIWIGKRNGSSCSLWADPPQCTSRYCDLWQRKCRP